MKIIALIFIRFSYVSLIRNSVTGPLRRFEESCQCTGNVQRSRRVVCQKVSKRQRTTGYSQNNDDDDDDKLYLTTLTLSAEAGFHNGRVKNINKLLQVK